MGEAVALLSAADVRRLARRIADQARDSRADAALRRELQKLDLDAEFTPGARAAFQDLLGQLGIATRHPIGLPENDEPFWFRIGHPLANHQ